MKLFKKGILKLKQAWAKTSTLDKATIFVITIINILILIYFAVSPVDPEHVSGLGLFAVTVVSLLNSASFFSPIPSFVLTFFAARQLPVIPLLLLSTLVVSIGEIMVYAFGDGVEELVKHYKWHGVLEKWFYKSPFVFLVIWVALPNPIQSIGQVFAATVNYPFWKYFLATLLGNLIWYGMVIAVALEVF